MGDDLQSTAKRFEELCRQILEENGYRLVSSAFKRYSPNAPIGGPDLIVSDPETELKTVVEIKLYRALFVDRSLLRNACAQVVRYKQMYDAPRGMLIATSSFNERDRKLIRKFGVDELWELSDLARKASTVRDTYAELFRLLRVAEVQGANLFDVESSTLYPETPEQDVTATEDQGQRLAMAFEGTQPGRADAKKFETLCCKAVEYLFGEHLGPLIPQSKIEEGFQYMDLVARLAPKATDIFWNALAQDFGCRYIVFEFKNYTEAISQNQIYTTEKYLYPNALRSVAIIIARQGADAGAVRAIQGALRESKKVLLVLSLEDLETLLRGKDQGDDPSDRMTDYLDKLLTTIAP